MWIEYICEIKGETKQRLQGRYLINKFTKINIVIKLYKYLAKLENCYECSQHAIWHYNKSQEKRCLCEIIKCEMSKTIQGCLLALKQLFTCIFHEGCLINYAWYLGLHVIFYVLVLRMFHIWELCTAYSENKAWKIILTVLEWLILLPELFDNLPNVPVTSILLNHFKGKKWDLHELFGLILQKLGNLTIYLDCIILLILIQDLEGQRKEKG